MQIPELSGPISWNWPLASNVIKAGQAACLGSMGQQTAMEESPATTFHESCQQFQIQGLIWKQLKKSQRYRGAAAHSSAQAICMWSACVGADMYIMRRQGLPSQVCEDSRGRTERQIKHCMFLPHEIFAALHGHGLLQRLLCPDGAPRLTENMLNVGCA